MNKKGLKDLVWKLLLPVRVAAALIIGFVAMILLAFGGD
jgi:hypothetical protein